MRLFSAAHMPMPALRASMSMPPDVFPGSFTCSRARILSAKSVPIPCGAAGPGMKMPVNHALAVDKVGFVGQPIAVVVAESAYTAQDAVNLIRMESIFSPPWSIQNRRLSLDHRKCMMNSTTTFIVPGVWAAAAPSPTPLGLTDELFKQADKVVSLKISPAAPGADVLWNRVGSWPPTSWSQQTDGMDVHADFSHLVRTFVRRDHEYAREPYPGYCAGCWRRLWLQNSTLSRRTHRALSSRELARPVKWIENVVAFFFVKRFMAVGWSEYFEAAVKNDGTLLAIKCKCYCDMGAYMQLLTPAIPGLGLILMAGAYRCQSHRNRADRHVHEQSSYRCLPWCRTP